jgi:hypothetical protein
LRGNFQSRRPDSNRRPLHYEALILVHTDLALRRPFQPVIPHSLGPLFRIHSACAQVVGASITNGLAGGGWIDARNPHLFRIAVGGLERSAIAPPRASTIQAYRCGPSSPTRDLETHAHPALADPSPARIVILLEDADQPGSRVRPGALRIDSWTRGSSRWWCCARRWRSGGRVRMDSRMRRCAGVSCEVVSMPDTVAPVGIGRARSRTGTDPGR